MLLIHHPTGVLKGNVKLPASKSISNRLLIISALTQHGITISNLSIADDTRIMKLALSQLNEPIIHVGDAGTVFRFMTSFLSISEGSWLLTGSDRMKSRPIAPLVESLQRLGAEIKYEDIEGFPPLRITGKKIQGGKVRIDGSVSSQFITSLMLIGPSLPKGLTIEFSGKVTSRPFINMTAAVMKACGAIVDLKNDVVEIPAGNYQPISLPVEDDWTAASYWYEIVALSKKGEVSLQDLQLPSIQGDSILSQWMSFAGVITESKGNGIELSSTSFNCGLFEADFTDCPDLAMTFAATCVGLKIPARLCGLENLVIKESDRLIAMQNELRKLNKNIRIEEGCLVIEHCDEPFPDFVSFETYNDHRMAMSLAPLALCVGQVGIQNPEVVSKSYPHFWKDMESAGFVLRS